MVLSFGTIKIWFLVRNYHDQTSREVQTCHLSRVMVKNVENHWFSLVFICFHWFLLIFIDFYWFSLIWVTRLGPKQNMGDPPGAKTKKGWPTWAPTTKRGDRWKVDPFWLKPVTKLFEKLPYTCWYYEIRSLKCYNSSRIAQFEMKSTYLDREFHGASF